MSEVTAAPTQASVVLAEHAPQPLAIVQAKPSFIIPANFAELIKLADLIAGSDLAPKDYRGKPGNTVIAIQMGMELGISPLMAIQNISVINGRAGVWGDLMLALVLASPTCEGVDEPDLEEIARTGVAWTIARRKGQAPKRVTFTREDAKKAGLLGKDTYKNYEARMLQMRARAFALRDKFADVLRGIACREEIEDLAYLEAQRATGNGGAPGTVTVGAPIQTAPAPVKPATIDVAGSSATVPPPQPPAPTQETPAQPAPEKPQAGAKGDVTGLVVAWNENPTSRATKDPAGPYKDEKTYRYSVKPKNGDAVEVITNDSTMGKEALKAKEEGLVMLISYVHKTMGALEWNQVTASEAF